jgi:hypothetical protein
MEFSFCHSMEVLNELLVRIEYISWRPTVQTVFCFVADGRTK